jgi:phosphoribosyl 1,2-cyclic phosphodiesterase
MKISFYGARGSIPTPMSLDDYQAKIKKIINLYRKQKGNPTAAKFLKTLPFDLSHIHGGNTACVTIEDGETDMIILDAGSGLRMLGHDLEGKSNLTLHVFLSHYHWDHICGIPFFKPLYNPSNTVIFYSPNEEIIQNLCRNQHHAHFPMPFQKLPARKKFVILDSCHHYELNGYDILNIPMYHPGGCTSYILQKEGKKVSYATDTEFTPENIKEKSHFYKACFESSDMLILDCQYSLSEFFSKFEWGHTSANMAVNLSLDWRVKKLVMFHFDPTHTEVQLEKIKMEAIKQKKQFNKRNLEIINALEGSSLTV